MDLKSLLNHYNMRLLFFFKEKITFIVLTILPLFLFLISSVKAQEGGKRALNGLNESAQTGYGGTPTGTIPGMIGNIIGSILAFTGIIFFLLIIYGGFTWMMARGNEQEVTKAKGMIESAAIGLVIILAAYAITAFVGNALVNR